MKYKKTFSAYGMCSRTDKSKNRKCCTTTCSYSSFTLDEHTVCLKRKQLHETLEQLNETLPNDSLVQEEIFNNYKTPSKNEEQQGHQELTFNHGKGMNQLLEEDDDTYSTIEESIEANTSTCGEYKIYSMYWPYFLVISR